MADFLLHHGYAVLFALSLIAQLGAPLPLTPLLIAAGALAKVGQISFAGVVALSVAASALGHLVWYEAGRRRGNGYNAASAGSCSPGCAAIRAERQPVA